MKAIRVVLVWLILVSCAWGQPIEGGIEKIEDSERLEWIHYEPPPARWAKCDPKRIAKLLLDLKIYRDRIGGIDGCVMVGDSIGRVESATIFLKVYVDGWTTPDSYIIEMNPPVYDLHSPYHSFRIYQPQADRKNVTEKFIKTRRE